MKFMVVIPNPKGEIIGSCCRFIEYETNNSIELEGSLQVITSVKGKGLEPMIMEGDYQITVNMEEHFQNGQPFSKVSIH